MTTAPALPAPACPECRTPLSGSAACPGCALPLTGPDAARLWEVDVALHGLERRRTELLVERGRLIRTLRGAVPAAACPPAPAALPVAAREEWTPRRVQNLLLSLGALLLAVAAAVFGAVTYDRLGLSGRAAVLLSLTAVAALAAPRLRARGLGATAESVAGVALALAALDAWGLRRLGLGDDLRDVTWLAVVCGVLAATLAGYAMLTSLRLPRLTSVALAHVGGLLAVVRLEPTTTEASLLLSLFGAGQVVAVAALARRAPGEAVRDLRAGAAVGAASAGTAGVLLAAVAVLVGDPAALALVGSALLAAGAAALPGAARGALAALPVPLLAGAALVAAADAGVDTPVLPLVAAAVALAGVAGAALLRAALRGGVVAGGVAVAAGALAAVAEHVLSALMGPTTWLLDPWSLATGTGTSARQALTPELGWGGTPAVVGVLLLVAATVDAAGRLLGRRPAAAAVTGTLALVALLLVPVALDVAHGLALPALVVVVAALLAAAEVLPGHRGALLPGAVAAAVLAGCWSLADEGATLVVLPVLTLLAALTAARSWTPTAATALAALLTGASVAATGAARDLAPEQVGGLLLVVPAALVALGRLVDPGRRAGAEAATAVLTAVAVVLAVGDVGWLSWTLAAAGLLALVVALGPHRRLLAPVGGLLLTASSWVRLAEAGVDAPEPYVLPLAVLALGLGHLRFTRDPAASSQAAYGTGLGLLLLPGLAAALTGSGLARPLLLGALALGVLLVGVEVRLQAPLLFGGGTLAVLALDLLAPYASAVPRWTALAAAGTLLVVVGATFEQRRSEMGALRTRYSGLR